MKVNSKAYTMRLSELTAKDSAALRRQTGMSTRLLLSAASTDPDLDTVAALVWLARRQAGDEVTFDDVAEEIGYDADIESVEEPAEEDPDSPEA